MKLIRPIIVGFLLGGSFGAKIGTYTSTALNVSSDFIFEGLLVGGSIGIVIGLLTAVSKEG